MLEPGRLTIQEIKVILQGEPEQRFLKLCVLDERQGVRQIVQAYLKQAEKRSQEDLRLEKLYSYEQELWQRGHTNIAGIDEVGRGPLAGPVVAGAVVLPGKLKLVGLNDSKQVPEKRRIELARQIRQQALGWSIGIASVQEIDELNILGATKLAMARAIEGLGMPLNYVLIDAVKLEQVKIAQQAIVGGDTLSASIAAASILAKVYRDELMNKIHEDYPCYNFAANKGYLTSEHAQALNNFGPCALHRTSFAPVRAVKTGKTTI